MSVIEIIEYYRFIDFCLKCCIADMDLYIKLSGRKSQDKKAFTKEIPLEGKGGFSLLVFLFRGVLEEVKSAQCVSRYRL